MRCYTRLRYVILCRTDQLHEIEWERRTGNIKYSRKNIETGMLYLERQNSFYVAFKPTIIGLD